MRAAILLFSIPLPLLLTACCLGTAKPRKDSPPDTPAFARPITPAPRRNPKPAPIPQPETTKTIPTPDPPAPQLTKRESEILAASRSYKPRPRNLLYDQAAIQLDSSIRQYYITYTLETENLVDSLCRFTFFVDVERVGNASWSFCATGRVFGEPNLFRTHSPGPGPRKWRRPPLEDNKEISVEHSLDMAQNRWRILLDGEQVFDGPLKGKSIRWIRFSMGFWGDEENADVKEVAATISNLAIHPNQLGPQPR